MSEKSDDIEIPPGDVWREIHAIRTRVDEIWNAMNGGAERAGFWEKFRNLSQRVNVVGFLAVLSLLLHMPAAYAKALAIAKGLIP